MADKMTEDEWREFAGAGTRTGKLATVRADGNPHVTPVWFLLDGPDVVFNTDERSVKGRNLARDPRAMLCIDEEIPPYAFVLLRGRAELSRDPAQLRLWATRIGARYMGEDRGTEFGDRNGAAGELLVRMRIDSVTATRGVAD